MPKIKLELGAELDILNGTEFAEGLGKAQSSLLSELARGLKSVRVAPIPLQTVTGTIAGQTFTVGGDAPNSQQFGPREGYVWSVRRVSVYGDQSVDSIQVFRGDPTQRANFICTIPLSTGRASFGKGELILHPGENLAFTGTGITSTIMSIGAEAIEAPAPMIYKLLA